MPDSTTCISKSLHVSLVNIYNELFKYLTVWPSSLCLSLPPVSYWLPPLNTSGQTGQRLSLTSPILWASGLRQIVAATRKSRWTPREGRSWTRRSWTGIGWTGCTRFRVPRSCSAWSTSTPPSAALSWWWWPCWCSTCKWSQHCYIYSFGWFCTWCHPPSIMIYQTNITGR